MMLRGREKPLINDKKIKERKDFKIVLVRGPILQTKKAINNEATPPLSYVLLKTYLTSKGYAVEIIDGIALGLDHFWPWPANDNLLCQGANFAEIIKKIPGDVDLLGFTSMFSPEWPVNKELIKETKKVFPQVTTVVGGEHVTAMPEYSLRDCPELNYIAAGEGELVLFNLAEALRRKQNLKEVKGIKYLDKDNNFIAHQQQPRIRELQSLPTPDWREEDLKPYWQARKSYGILSERDMPIMVSRGCPYQCTFCSNDHMWSTKYFLRDVDEVIKEIESYLKRFQITSLQFYDLTAIVKRDWVIDFCQKMIERKIKVNWSLPSGTRCEALDKEVLQLLAKTGCNYLVYAPESGSARTRKEIKKMINIAYMLQSMKDARKEGIVLRSNLIIGFPNESRLDIFKTIFFGLKLAILGVDEVSINLYMPYPGSQLFDQLLEEKKLTVNDDYFYAIASFNADYTKMNALTFNQQMSQFELSFLRALFILINYIFSYLFHPRRIWRTIKNIFKPTQAATVFEHRLQDLFKRRKS